MKHIQNFIKRKRLERYCSPPEIVRQWNGKMYIKVFCSETIAEAIAVLPNVLSMYIMLGDI